MKSNEFITEAPTGQNEYQQMVNFINGNKTPGVPADQQVALALFRELQRQKQTNQELGQELDAAEKRIDVATQSGELASQELGKHRGELERERGAMDQQRGAMDKIDQQNAERAKASDEQISVLTTKLEQIKAMPGISKTEAAKLDQQIKELSKNGASATKVKDLEMSLSAVQNMQQVDDNAIKDLVAQVKDAQAKAAEIDQTKKELGGELEKSTQQAQDEVEQLKQKIAQITGLGQTVGSIRAELDDLETNYEETNLAVFDLEDKVDQINRSLNAKNTAASTVNQIRQAPQQAAQAHAVKPAPKSNVDPRLVQSLMKQGIFKPEPVEESKLLKAIKWATGK
jgi:chromosome segregation ATPase